MKIKFLLSFLLIAISMLFLTDCKKDDDDDCYLTGTVSDYGGSDIYEGNLYIIFIDVDGDPENDNHVKMLLGTWHGTAIPYSIDISDVTYLVDYLFGGGDPPPCPEQANVDGIEIGGVPINVSDLTAIVDYLFNSGPTPPDCP